MEIIANLYRQTKPLPVDCGSYEDKDNIPQAVPPSSSQQNIQAKLSDTHPTDFILLLPEVLVDNIFSYIKASELDSMVRRVSRSFE